MLYIMTSKGTIANINNNYVILNDKRFIEQTSIVNKLLPGDTVEYETTNKNTINILKLNSRSPQIILGIVKNITIDNDKDKKNIEIFCPGLPKKFAPDIPFSKEYKMGNVLIIQIEHRNCIVLSKYDSIQDRRNDKDIVLQLYKMNATLSTLYPKYKQFSENTAFTEPYQDLTHLETFNVDPTNSKDFDDAISVDNNRNTVYVHIVDAHEQIVPSSSLDINAALSAFTLYLQNDHIENILPKEFAEFNLSLVKNEIRKVITVEFEIDPETQNIIQYKLYKSSIIIKNRYDYEGFTSVIHNYPILTSFYEKWKRNTLNIPHIRMNIHPETGNITNYWFEKNNDIAHKVIETFMILTNITISKHIPNIIPQRFHCKSKGEFVADTFFGNEIIDAIFSIKQYRPAIYDATNEGHFGLGLNSYTHFTSPIRRYFDVIIHRLLSGVEYENLEDILQHINKREIYIEKIVKLYEQLKILSFLENQLTKVWKGYVVNKTTVGYVVLLEELLFEIFIFENKYNLSVKDIVNVKITAIKWNCLEVKAVIIK